MKFNLNEVFQPKLFGLFKKGAYNGSTFTSDLIAGIIVGIIALPLAIAFATASGVPPQNGLITAAEQWLERSLDDSANRRLSMADGFLCTDGLLMLYENVSSNLTVNRNVITKHLNAGKVKNHVFLAQVGLYLLEEPCVFHLPLRCQLLFYVSS